MPYYLRSSRENSLQSVRELRLPVELTEKILEDHIVNEIHDALNFALTTTLDPKMHPLPASVIAAQDDNKSTAEGARRVYDAKVKKERRKIRSFTPIMDIAHSTHSNRRYVETVMKNLLPICLDGPGYAMKWTVPFVK